MLKKVCGNCAYWNTMRLEHVICKKCSKDKRSLERAHFMPRNRNCPICECKMMYNKGEAFLRCEDCNTEIWPFAKGKTIKDAAREQPAKMYRTRNISDIILSAVVT